MATADSDAILAATGGLPPWVFFEQPSAQACDCFSDQVPLNQTPIPTLLVNGKPPPPRESNKIQVLKSFTAGAMQTPIETKEFYNMDLILNQPLTTLTNLSKPHQQVVMDAIRSQLMVADCPAITMRNSIGGLPEMPNHDSIRPSLAMLNSPESLYDVGGAEQDNVASFHWGASSTYSNATRSGATRFRPTKTSKEILMYHFGLEKNPQKNEINAIAEKTGMQAKQVYNWFRNKRKRTTPEELTEIRSIASKGSLPLTTDSLDALASQLVDAEAGQEESSYSLGQPNLFSMSTALQGVSSQFPHFNRSSDTQSMNSRLSLSTLWTTTSRRSMASQLSNASRSSKISKSSSPNSRSPRRGRRKWTIGPGTDRTSSMEMSNFYCTFCWAATGHSTRYAWKRHEEEQHVMPPSWVCNPGTIPTATPFLCPYCLEEHLRIACPLHALEVDPVAITEHLEWHKHVECVSKQESDRTFFRKSHLAQHLNGTHRVASDKTVVTAAINRNWLRPCTLTPALETLICPFASCKAESKTWDERTSHVAGHFRAIKARFDQRLKQVLKRTPPLEFYNAWTPIDDAVFSVFDGGHEDEMLSFLPSKIRNHLN